MSRRDCLLVCNAGSATVKVKIFKLADLSVQVSGQVERIGLPGSTLEVQEMTSGRMIRRNFPPGMLRHDAAFAELASHLQHWAGRLRAAAHRVVHGGEEFRKPTWLNRTVREKLKAISGLAPLHNPINLAVVDAVQTSFPQTPNIAVFDTGYYANLPPEAYLYALPYEYYEQLGIRRYGFHGLSHQYLARAAAASLKRPILRLRLITCHLGSGCSVTATKFGTAIDTSMGFSPLEGVAMGTRSGDLDPAIVTFLQKKLNLSAGAVEDILNRKSGMLGLFGYSGDLRDVLVAAGFRVADHPVPRKFTAEERKRAKLALGVFVYDVAGYVGRYAAIMGGADAIVFSGAIGARSQIIRTLIRQRISHWRGLRTLVIPTDEELMMAQLVQRMVQRYRPTPLPPAPSSKSDRPPGPRAEPAADHLPPAA